MPYHVAEDSSSCPADRPHAVVKEGGEVMGCHATVDEADAQVAALYASEPEASAPAATSGAIMGGMDDLIEFTPAPVAANIAMNAGVGVSPLAFVRFAAEAGDWKHVRSADVESVLTWGELLSTAEAIGAELIINAEGCHSADAVFRLSTKSGAAVALAHLDIGWNEWHIDVAADTSEAAEDAAAALGVLLPPRPRSTAHGVDVTFWMQHPMAGAVSRRKAVDLLPWEEVASNYPASIRPQLDELMSLSDAPTGGRMMVFHGPPGTGKTRFVQAIAAAWSEWCDIDFIIDADEMFASALYLNTVLLDGENDPGRWRLIVIEDGDEFIDVDAKARVGAGAARLLNVADGLIGQGLRVMVLVTTNVSSTKFSQAITRTGRCGALIEFPPFTEEEAAVWLAERGVEGEATPMTLAELYGTTR